MNACGWGSPSITTRSQGRSDIHASARLAAGDACRRYLVYRSANASSASSGCSKASAQAELRIVSVGRTVALSPSVWTSSKSPSRRTSISRSENS